jgi:hypothetical protein
MQIGWINQYAINGNHPFSLSFLMNSPACTWLMLHSPVLLLQILLLCVRVIKFLLLSMSGRVHIVIERQRDYFEPGILQLQTAHLDK